VLLCEHSTISFSDEDARPPLMLFHNGITLQRPLAVFRLEKPATAVPGLPRSGARAVAVK
jgi:hypothetical protein